MEIRSAKVGDARNIAEVHVAAWRSAYAGLMPDLYLKNLSVERRTALWDQSLSQPNPGAVLVAEDGKRIAGFCLYGPTRDADGKDRHVAEILAINIEPAFWRRGIGRALCQSVIEVSPQRGWTAITLWVLRENHRARDFYRNLGFAPDGSERIDTELVGSPLHELRYRKSMEVAV